jgi:hypothetical protein
MLNIYVPQTLYGNHVSERLIGADFTRVGRTVFMHIAHYPDFAVAVESVELRQGEVSLRGVPVGLPQAMAYQFEVPESCTHFQFNVHVDGQFCGRVEAQAYEPESKVFLTAATLFKGDYAQVRTWMDYHAAMGFERFVLYYNGKIDGILPELLAQEAVRNKDVLLVQWPFSYWVDGLGLGVEGLLAVHGEQADLSRRERDWHHAQQVMLNHALLMLRGTTNFVGFFDLDEYFRMERPGSLLDLLRLGQDDIYVFQSRWSELPSQRIPALSDGVEFFYGEEVVVSNEWVPFPHRAKYIGKPETILGTGAHVPKATLPGTRMVQAMPELGGVYHFHCFSGKAPRRNMINPNGEWVSAPDFLAPLAPRLAMPQKNAA